MTLAALVLAAGSATRFGSDKLSAPFRGEPLVHHAIRAARAAPVSRVVIVAHPALSIGTWPDAAEIEVLPLASTALSSSLRNGIAAVRECDGAFVFLGDVPLVPHDLAARLAERIGQAYAAVPHHAGKPGHPVLLSARAFADVMTLSGDEGAGRLLRGRDDVVIEDCADPCIRFDIDRPADLAEDPPARR
jgi:molybdenum cofactor cytidylyltransferase